MASAYDTAVAALSPVAWWKLDEPAGSSTCADSSGNGATATVATATLGNAGPSLPGLPDTCAQGFQNQDPNFTFTASAQLMAAMQDHDFTYVAWAKDANVTSGNDYIWCQFGLGSQGSGTGFAVEHWNTIFAVENGSSTAYNPSSGPIGVPWFNSTYPDYSIWRQFAWVYSAASQTFTCYVNGSSAGSYGPMAVDVSGSSGAIGILPYVESYTAWTGGYLSQIAVFGSALSASQIAGLYGAATGAVTGSASLPASLTLAAQGHTAHARSAGLAGSAALNAAGHAAHARSASLAGAGSLTAVGQVSHQRSASIAGSASLTAQGSVTHIRSVALGATATLTTSGADTHTRSGGVSASLTLSATGTVARQRAATLSATASLTATGTSTAQPAVGLAATASLTARGIVAHQRQVALQAVATLTAASGTSTVPVDAIAVVLAPLSPMQICITPRAPASVVLSPLQPIAVVT